MVYPKNQPSSEPSAVSTCAASSASRAGAETPSRPIDEYQAHHQFCRVFDGVHPCDCDGSAIPAALATATAARQAVEQKAIAFANDIATNYDHDNDAHRYGTTCRVCHAEEFLAALRTTDGAA